MFPIGFLTKYNFLNETSPQVNHLNIIVPKTSYSPRTLFSIYSCALVN